jgi:hypothetical protein
MKRRLGVERNCEHLYMQKEEDQEEEEDDG